MLEDLKDLQSEIEGKRINEIDRKIERRREKKMERINKSRWNISLRT